MSESSHSKDELREAIAAYRAKEADLKFPVAPGFNSRPPRLTPTEFVQWCEEMMSALGLSPDKPEQRFVRNTPERFVL